jgi:hypothetical protein
MDRVASAMLRALVLAMGSLLQLESATALPAAWVVPVLLRAAAVETEARSQSMRTKTES